MTMREDGLTIREWAVATFGEPENEYVVFDRALLELEELRSALDDPNTSYEHLAVEIADIFIVLSQIPAMGSIDVFSEVDRKMATNRKRVWNKNGDGTGSHVK